MLLKFTQSKRTMSIKPSFVSTDHAEVQRHSDLLTLLLVAATSVARSRQLTCTEQLTQAHMVY
jgi:hypothetical protein